MRRAFAGWPLAAWGGRRAPLRDWAHGIWEVLWRVWVHRSIVELGFLIALLDVLWCRSQISIEYLWVWRYGRCQVRETSRAFGIGCICRWKKSGAGVAITTVEQLSGGGQAANSKPAWNIEKGKVRMLQKSLAAISGPHVMDIRR